MYSRLVDVGYEYAQRVDGWKEQTTNGNILSVQHMLYIIYISRTKRPGLCLLPLNPNETAKGDLTLWHATASPETPRRGAPASCACLHDTGSPRLLPPRPSPIIGCAFFLPPYNHYNNSSNSSSGSSIDSNSNSSSSSTGDPRIWRCVTSVNTGTTAATGTTRDTAIHSAGCSRMCQEVIYCSGQPALLNQRCRGS